MCCEQKNCLRLRFSFKFFNRKQNVFTSLKSVHDYLLSVIMKENVSQSNNDITRLDRWRSSLFLAVREFDNNYYCSTRVENVL